MGSFKLAFQRQYRYIVAAAALLLAVVMPAIVSAAQVTERSIALSNSSADMDGVSYKLKFKAAGAAEAFVVEFCSNSPVIGQECTPPVGMDASNAATSTTDYAVVGGSTTANKITATKTIAANDDVEVDFTGINNPTNAGALYARIVTYTPAVNANSYVSDNLGTGVVDQGSVALYITNTVGVSGSVLESLTFCVAGDKGTVKTNDGISANCGDAAVNTPTLTLGEQTGDTVALVPTATSQGNIFAQISTNAANGAVIRLKSNAANCGGLLRAGALDKCDIKPSSDGIVDGDAEFGVKVAAATDPTGPGITPSGVFQPAAGSVYNGTDFLMHYLDNTTGVTGIYGDPILDTNNKPASNKNMKLTFGARINNDTPAGLYSADLSLIATGKF